MTIILGIDPGSRFTGYGVIRLIDKKVHYIASGCVDVSKVEKTPEKLHQIFEGLSEVLHLHQPHEAAIEQVFMHANASSALKLGQARGVAIAAAAHYGLPVAEYSARQVKQAVVGHGGAEKTQVQQMIKILLNLPRVPQADAADALAIALCHAHTHDSVKGISGVSGVKAGRWR